ARSPTTRTRSSGWVCRPTVVLDRVVIAAGVLGTVGPGPRQYSCQEPPQRRQPCREAGARGGRRRRPRVGWPARNRTAVLGSDVAERVISGTVDSGPRRQARPEHRSDDNPAENHHRAGRPAATGLDGALRDALSPAPLTP